MMKYFIRFFIFIILTILTQVGGIIYFISLFINRKIKFNKSFLKYFTFPLLYFTSTFLVIPQLAKINNREALPIFTSLHLKPHSFLTCLMNRHYVKPELKKVLNDIRYDVSIPILYFDANFPFLDGFPLLPHWSHNDGRKLDLAFVYKDKNNNVGHPIGFLGYGFCQKPKENEINYPQKCEEQGHIQYNLLQKLVNQANKEFTLDKKKTVKLISVLSSRKEIGKIFIEPHLKERWNLEKNDKIRFHGCHAVRHDDHIHIQL